MYHVYILACEYKGKTTYYTGFTGNLRRRMREHGTKRGARYTRNKKCALVYAERYHKRKNALRREREIKTYSHNEKKQLILAGSDINV